MKLMQLTSAGPYVEPVKFSPEQREKHILWYLGKKQTISSGDCKKINNCSRKTAQEDLRNMQEKGLITRIGPKKASIYVLKKE